MQGDVVIIGGKPFPRDVAEKRRLLDEQIMREGFEQVMEARAYTWFNRFVAVRFMEVHGYLEHGYRVLSTTPVEHPEREPGSTGQANHTNNRKTASGVPEIVAYAEHVDLPGLDREKVVELKLAGNRDEELYRMLLIAQCNALHKAMPFLFERIGDATELLLPENLLHSNSPVRNLVSEIPEDDWQQIEIIGWLYQFYISEKKDQVIGKVVKSEDIPAATQLFTPNWIVKYMVQNSLGAQWLATYPNSPLKEQMEYYIEPAEQTDEVRAQLEAITPSTLDPEKLTLIDPACGSGHILVEAYELFKAIYLERGYRQRDVAQLILEKNLFGLDIDGRAAQLTGFALVMKGRADDRRLFEREMKLNVMALVDSAGFDAERLAKGVHLEDYGLKPGDIKELKRLFEHATTLGSLIQVSEGLAAKLSTLKQLSETISHDLFVSDALKRLGSLVQQTELLAAQYDAVVANPPYMGSKYYCVALKNFVNSVYHAGKADTYGAFTLRNIQFAKENGHIGMITIPNWMFLASFEQLRNTIFRNAPITSLVHNGRGVWGADFGSCSYVLRRSTLEEENNRLFIDAYGLQDELTPDVPVEQITLTVNSAYRYGGKLTEEEQWTRFRQDTMAEVVSYAIGCMMGRCSLDTPGLIYAHSGNNQFREIYHEKHNHPLALSRENHSCNSCYSWSTFPPDADGIVPLTDTDWFHDDAAHRLIEFISVAWPKEHLEENLKFVSESLSPKRGESPRETIRRHISTGFFKHHLKTYKKRPIYWLFSSGKLRAFQCLVYLHRYNEGMLSRMRTEYVIPLQGKISARIEQLSGDINAATSTAHSKKMERERGKLVKQQAELQGFDEKLRHYADQRISLDLDDGVKVNYGKFGDLLAEVKAVTGKKKK